MNSTDDPTVLTARFEVTPGRSRTTGTGSIGPATAEFTLSVDLEVARGEVLAVVGPNGAGKSTLLRCIAGVEPVDCGTISVAARVFDQPTTGAFTHPDGRGVAMMFQDHLLFPHLSALDNVAFGPRAGGAGRNEARTSARRWLERMALTEHTRSRPHELSGGQAQRVALARALATEPDVLLLDEPLAALDATVRAAVQRNLRDHLDSFAGATIVVSHDPLDAFVLADRVAVLEAGRVTQSGSIAEVTSRPRTRYVADLLGVNLLHGRGDGHVVTITGPRPGPLAAVGHDGDPSMEPAPDPMPTVRVGDPVQGPALVVIRPRSVSLHRDRPDTSARNVWRATVRGMDALGDRVRVHLDGPFELTAEVTPAAVSELGLREGRILWMSVKATEVDSYPD